MIFLPYKKDLVRGPFWDAFGVNLFSAILSPFGYILELSLKGTLDEPVWRFKIDPRNLFDNGGAVEIPEKQEASSAASAPVSDTAAGGSGGK